VVVSAVDAGTPKPSPKNAANATSIMSLCMSPSLFARDELFAETFLQHPNRIVVQSAMRSSPFQRCELLVGTRLSPSLGYGSQKTAASGNRLHQGVQEALPERWLISVDSFAGLVAEFSVVRAVTQPAKKDSQSDPRSHDLAPL
jgi:hypothetical protein